MLLLITAFITAAVNQAADDALTLTQLARPRRDKASLLLLLLLQILSSQTGLDGCPSSPRPHEENMEEEFVSCWLSPIVQKEDQMLKLSRGSWLTYKLTIQRGGVNSFSFTAWCVFFYCCHYLDSSPTLIHSSELISFPPIGLCQIIIN